MGECKIKKWLVFVFLLILMTILAAGCSQGGTLAVKDAWARPAVTGGNSAVYFTIDNRAGQPDSLLSASSQVAQTVELHQSMQKDDGTMAMHMQASVPIPAGETVEFTPGGLHVMLINLPNDLQVGDTFPLSLNFQNAGAVNLDVTVREP